MHMCLKKRSVLLFPPDVRTLSNAAPDTLCAPCCDCCPTPERRVREDDRLIPPREPPPRALIYRIVPYIELLYRG